MTLPRKRFAAWVERRLLDPGALPDAFSVWHCPPRQSPALVSRLRRPEGRPDHVASQLAESITEEVSDHVAAMGVRQSYAVRAHSEGDDVGEFRFTAEPAALATHTQTAESLTQPTPELASAGARTVTDMWQIHPQTAPMGPDMAALGMIMGQQMRHNETLIRYNAELAAMHRERDAQIISSQARQLEEHSRRQLEIMGTLEDLQSRRQEREIEAAKYEDEKDRQDRLLAKINGLVIPAVARKLGMGAAALMGDGAAAGAGADPTGAPSAAAKVSADGGGAATIKKIFMRLPDHMQDAVVQALSEEDQRTLLSIFEEAGRESRGSGGGLH